MKVLYDFIRHILNIIGFRQTTQRITKLDIEEILLSYTKDVSYSHEFESPEDQILYSKILDNLSDLISDDNSSRPFIRVESAENTESVAVDKNDIVSVSDLTTNFDYNMLSTMVTSDDISPAD